MAADVNPLLRNRSSHFNDLLESAESLCEPKSSDNSDNHESEIPNKTVFAIL